MNPIFEEAKAMATPEQAASAYGLRVEKHRALCPFHNDHHPSLSFHGMTFRCFSCGEKGDVIALVAKLFDLSAYDAAKKICQDFGGGSSTPYERAVLLRRRQREEDGMEWCDQQFFALCELYKQLDEVKRALAAPMSEQNDPPQALLRLWSMEPVLEEVLDTLTTGSREERLRLYQTQRKEVEDLVHCLRIIFRSVRPGEHPICRTEAPSGLGAGNSGRVSHY